MPPAPDFDLSPAASSAALRGMPYVIAIVEAWTPGHLGSAEMARLRGELRGIGASLLVVTREEAWLVGADDPGDIVATGSERFRAERARLRFQLSGVDLDDALSAVFVIDRDGAVCFSFVADDHANAAVDVNRALVAAGRELMARVEDVPAPRMPSPAASPSATMTRRQWTTLSLTAMFAVAFAESCGTSHDAPLPTDAGAAPQPAVSEVDVVLRINGSDHSLRIEPRVTLLDALRERLELTGTKKGCDHGQCGACTVLVGGARVNACLTLAVMAEGREITTIEGLAKGEELHPMQAAFLAEDGFQCGYCTPGQIMSAVGFVAEGGGVDPDEVREGMSGNLCRCGAYPNIVSAIVRAKRTA